MSASATPPGGFDTTRNMVAQFLKVRLLRCLGRGLARSFHKR
jgi:hypothetical protein